MRRVLVVGAVAALSFMGVGSVSGADGIQRLYAEITPTKLDRKKFVPAKLLFDNFIGVNDESAPEGEQPPSASRIRLDFPRNARFRTGTFPRCLVGPEELEDRTAAEQENLCGKNSKVSVDSGSSAQVTYDATPLAPAGDSIVTSVELQLFNGREKGSIYLATDPDGRLMNTPTIVGMLRKSDAGRTFRTQLDMTIPSLTFGAFSDLKATIAAGDYLQARCRKRTNSFQARVEYADHSPTSASREATCKAQKKKKKK